jgi:Glycosyl transferases group 1.
MKSKLLFLAPQNPYPPNNGGKISIYFPIKYLSKFFEIYLITPVKYIDDEVKESVKHFESLNVKYYPVIKNTDDKPVDLLKNIFIKTPFKWYKYYSDEIYYFCEDLINSKNINYVFTSAPHMGLYSIRLKERYPNLKIFLREHNIEFTLVEQFVNFTKNPMYKLIGRWQLKKTKVLEQKYWELFDKVFFISDYDYEIAKKLRPDLNNKFYVLYDGFELNKNKICKKTTFDKKFIIPSNVKATQNHVNTKWFIEHIWIPLINWIKKNNFSLSITGGSKDDWEQVLKLRNLEKFNIEFPGFVKDIDEEICKYKYVISPTIMGSGLRLKLLHGMALGKVVFATEFDVKTSKLFKDMYNIVSFNNHTEFVKKLELLEKNADLYQSIKDNAIRTINDYLNWNKYAENVVNIIRELERGYN